MVMTKSGGDINIDRTNYHISKLKGGQSRRGSGADEKSLRLTDLKS